MNSETNLVLIDADHLSSHDFNEFKYIGELREIYSLDLLSSAFKKKESDLRDELIKFLELRIDDIYKISEVSDDSKNILTKLRQHQNKISYVCKNISEHYDSLFEKFRIYIRYHQIISFKIIIKELSLALYNNAKLNSNHLESIQNSYDYTIHSEIIAYDISCAKYFIDMLLDKFSMLPREEATNHQESMDLEKKIRVLSKEEATNHQESIDIEISVLHEIKRLNSQNGITLKSILLIQFKEIIHNIFNRKSNESCIETIISAGFSTLTGLLCLNEIEAVEAYIKDHITNPKFIKILENHCIKNSIEKNPKISQNNFNNNLAFCTDVLQSIQNEWSLLLRLLSDWFNSRQALTTLNILDIAPTNDTMKVNHMETVIDNQCNLILNCFIIPFVSIISDHFSMYFIPMNSQHFFKFFRASHDIIDVLTLMMGEKEKKKFLIGSLWNSFTVRWKTDVYESDRLRQYWDLLQKNFKSLQVGNKISVTLPFLSSSMTCLEVSLHVFNNLFNVINPDFLILREISKSLRYICEVALYYGDFIKNNILSNLSVFKDNNLVYSVQDLYVLIMALDPNKDQSVANKILRAMDNKLSCDSFHLYDTDHKINNKQLIESIFVDISNEFVVIQIMCQKECTLQLWQQVKKILVAMKGIPSLYWMTNRQVSGKPSVYIEKSLETLENFYNVLNTLTLEDTYKKEWMKTILSDIYDILADLVNEVLNIVVLQDKSLKKLTKGQSVAIGISNDTSKTMDTKCTDMEDLYKIYKQLYIDTKYFEDHINGLFSLSRIEFKDDKPLPGYLKFLSTIRFLHENNTIK